MSNNAAMKKLLVYAHYYTPDVASTGQILKEMAEGMSNKFDITVICAVPSYTGKIVPEYKTQKYYKEESNGINVIRIRVPEFSKGNKKSRIRNIVSYFFGAMKATYMVGKIDYVFAISQPPILGGVLGVWGKWIKKAKFIYCIQDFNPEQTIAVGYSKNRCALSAMLWFDKFSCKRADKVFTVGRDLVETLKKRFRGKKVPNYAFINNWIDEKEIYPLPAEEQNIARFKAKYELTNKFVFMYSGNIGLYYDLENLMSVINKFNNRKDVVFAFVGEGSVKSKLVLYKEKHHMDNVIFVPYQDKAELVYSLNAADVHWCVNSKGIKGVSVPSKLYGIMAAGKPVLGVLEKGSEAQLIIKETQCGYVVEPGDYNGVERIIQMYIESPGNELSDMGSRGREYLIKNLTKDVSVKKYVDEILSC